MALERLLDSTESPPDPERLYTQLFFPDPPAHRPYVYINMVSTADGKIVIGKPGGPARGVGGATDQLLFRRLQQPCDGALIGSATLRASQVLYPPEKARFVVTASGDVPLDNRFFTDAPGRAFVIAPETLPTEARHRITERAQLLAIGHGRVHLAEALQRLRQEHGIRLLLCEGGAALNDQLLRAGLADELFLTLAPKLKGGAQLPTIVGGEGFPPGRYLPLNLLSLYRDGDECYLRYCIGTEGNSSGL